MFRRLLERRPWLGGVVLFLGCLLVLGAEFRTTTLRPVSLYDEGFILVSAQRLAHGQLPYADYDPVYGPLEPAVMALVGPRILALRLWRAAGLSLVVALCFVYVRRLGAAPLAPLAAAGVIVGSSLVVHPALSLLTVVGALLAVALRAQSSRRWLLGCGALVGATALARPDFGGLAGLAAAATVVASHWQHGRSRGRAVGDLVFLTAGALPALAVYGALFAAGPEPFLANLRALGSMRAYAVLPYPLPPPAETDGRWIQAIVALIPPIAIVATWPNLGRRLWRRRAGGPPVSPLALYLGLVLPGLFLYALSRADQPHLFPVFALGLTSLIALIRPALADLDALTRSRLQRASVVVLAAALLLRSQATLAARTAEPLAVLNTPALEGLLGPSEVDAFYAQLAAQVDALAPRDAPLFVGLARTRADGTVVPDHTQIYTNDALVYRILGRRPALRQHCLVMGWTSTAAKQEALVEEFELRRPPVVLLRLDVPLPRQNPDLPGGSTVLDRYLIGHYAPVGAVGPYLLLTRQ